MGDVDSALTGAGGFQFCWGVSNTNTAGGSENLPACAPLCKARPVFRPKSPDPQSPGRPCRASEQSVRPQSSRGYPSGYSGGAQTTKGNGVKGDAGALSGSKGPPCLSLVLAEHRYLQVADRRQENATRWHKLTDDSKIFGEAMPNKGTARIH